MNIRSFDIAVSSRGRPLVQVDGYPVYHNEISFLFGESGIGKSLISKALYGLLGANDLSISIDRNPYGTHLKDPWTRSVRQNSFFVFQEPSSHLNPLMTIRQQLNEGSLSGLPEEHILSKLWATSSDGTLSRILDVFPKPYRPSGGEKQRILLAMAFKRIDAWIAAHHTDVPNYFVFDEPTGSLDNTYRNLFMDYLFEKYHEKPFTILIITHDYSIISEIYKHHRNLIDRIHFKELSRASESQVAVDDFSAEDYFSWLDAPHMQHSSERATETVLEVSPRFSIFGRDLSIYADSGRTRLQPLRINRGEMVYLKAPSGIGKTTLAKIIMGIYRADRFSMKLDNLSLSNTTGQTIWAASIWGKRAGMVFQHADESLNLASTVRETFKGLPLEKKLSSRELTEYLMELFDRPLSDTFLNKKVAYLSGGQKQRLNLLRTLILGTSLIILDEPLNGLDFLSVKKVLGLLDEQQARGSALLMISHNEEIFEHFIDEKNIYYLGVTV